ncbi:Hypothetical predicted protein [Olea europaea subsp. europaea]|uniref:Uncharacterized protein n=1 Tax=Olea europaea subsp. europaea TaxID=158383 RepID=A0A8S0PHT4_OLEEU|nr:Hypothetical predicted protein [Olea europaea subsp. europaea]
MIFPYCFFARRQRQSTTADGSVAVEGVLSMMQVCGGDVVQDLVVDGIEVVVLTVGRADVGDVGGAAIAGNSGDKALVQR